MFTFCSLYSGSTGNCLLVQTDETKILIDAGVSQKKISDALASFNVDFSDINAILVTHEHADHVLNLGSISKKYNIPVYCNEKTLNAMPAQKEKIADENKKIFISICFWFYLCIIYFPTSPGPLTPDSGSWSSSLTGAWGVWQVA